MDQRSLLFVLESEIKVQTSSHQQLKQIYWDYFILAYSTTIGELE